jgi:hypothetical protein
MYEATAKHKSNTVTTTADPQVKIKGVALRLLALATQCRVRKISYCDRPAYEVAATDSKFIRSCSPPTTCPRTCSLYWNRKPRSHQCRTQQICAWGRKERNWTFECRSRYRDVVRRDGEGCQGTGERTGAVSIEAVSIVSGRNGKKDVVLYSCINHVTVSPVTCGKQFAKKYSPESACAFLDYRKM